MSNGLTPTTYTPSPHCRFHGMSTTPPRQFDPLALGPSQDHSRDNSDSRATSTPGDAIAAEPTVPQNQTTLRDASSFDTLHVLTYNSLTLNDTTPSTDSKRRTGTISAANVHVPGQLQLLQERLITAGAHVACIQETRS
eukprot:6482494-Amphidinium_carterae.1